MNRLISVLLSAMLPQTMLLADHGYDADWIREPAAIRWRVAKAIILASVLESSSGDFESASDQANSTPRTNQPLQFAGPAEFLKQNNRLSQNS
jgi:hypothetical protein